jgi:hypothetical protein
MLWNMCRGLRILENVSIAPGMACTSGSFAAERIVSEPTGTRLQSGIALTLSNFSFVDCHWSGDSV